MSDSKYICAMLRASADDAMGAEPDDRATFTEAADRIEELESQLSERKRAMTDRRGTQCACRFDESDNNTNECMHHKEIRERLAQAQKDAERLDFLEGHVSMIRDIGWIPITTVEYDGKRHIKWSLRKTIDAAIDKDNG